MHIANEIARKIKAEIYDRLNWYQLEYDADQLADLCGLIANIANYLVDDEDVVWSYIVQTVRGWVPSPSRDMGLGYNSPVYNAREMFCIVVSDLALNTWRGPECYVY